MSSRALTITAVALDGGATGIRVEALETWIVPRPAAEKIPAGVHEIDVTSARQGAAPIVALKVTAPAKVRRITRLLDQLPMVQPGAGYSCPAAPLPPDPIVRFDFLAAVGKPALARAQVADYGHALGPCNAISFSIRGHHQRPLVGDNILTKVQRLLGINFR